MHNLNGGLKYEIGEESILNKGQSSTVALALGYKPQHSHHKRRALKVLMLSGLFI